MSIEMGVFEAKTRLSELVERVSRGGEDIVITKRGRPVARLSSAASTSSVEDALAFLLAAREGSAPGEASLRGLIDEGRRR